MTISQVVSKNYLYIIHPLYRIVNTPVLAYVLPHLPWFRSHINAREHAASAQVAFRFNSFIGLALADKLAAGLQQFMAGARKFSLPAIAREDIFSANRETEKETGIPFITDVADAKAKKILKG
jgi:hypothetical protein